MVTIRETKNTYIIYIKNIYITRQLEVRECEFIIRNVMMRSESVDQVDQELNLHYFSYHRLLIRFTDVRIYVTGTFDLRAQIRTMLLMKRTVHLVLVFKDYNI